MSRNPIILSVIFSLFLVPVKADLIDEIILPRKTDIFISLQKGINSKTARSGDKFSAVIEVPVTHQDEIVIPVGSYIIGHVVTAESAGYIRGKGQLQLGFDTVILPKGTTRQIKAVVQSAENYVVDDASETGKMQGSGEQSEEVLVGVAKGGVTGLITGATVGAFTKGIAQGAAVGGAIGAAGGALLALLDKGEEVELPKGSSLTIQLQDAVQFTKPEPRTRGTRLNP
jgi:hypothetical protein